MINGFKWHSIRDGAGVGVDYSSIYAEIPSYKGFRLMGLNGILNAFRIYGFEMTS